MSFENVYRSKQGIKEVNKIAEFIGKLIIKNEYEAKAAETTESLSEYYQYFSAYTKTDDYFDYSISERKRLRSHVNLYLSSINNGRYTYNSGILNDITNKQAEELEKYKGKLPLYSDYIKALRLARVLTYEEKNTYYRQFMGLPNHVSDYLYVINYDASADGYFPVTNMGNPPEVDIDYYTKNTDGTYTFVGNKLKAWPDPSIQYYYLNTIPIHVIDDKRYPRSYLYYVLQDNISELIRKFPEKTYLKFIGKKFTSFYLRNLPNYSIIYYKDFILDGDELHYFFKAYNKAKTQVKLDYINGFDQKQPLYNILMIQNLLYYTIIAYSSSYIEKFSLGQYSDENVDNIFLSHGYESLTKIKDKKLKKKILTHLNDLIENKANNYVLDIIMDKILEDTNTELKRYYIEKVYTGTDGDGIQIDSSKGLEGCVDLVLREVSFRDINKVSKTQVNFQEYDKFVNTDDQWGGIDPADSNEIKKKKKAYLKKQILKLNFNSILTKYMTLSRTIDIISIQKQLKDNIYLMLSFFNENQSSEFFENKINFDQLLVTPAALFGAMCWLQQMLYYDDHDTIIKDNCVINSSVVFRKLGKSITDRYNFENKIIIDGEIIETYDISPEIGAWGVYDFTKDMISGQAKHNVNDIHSFDLYEFAKKHPFVFKNFKDRSGKRIESRRFKEVLKFDRVQIDDIRYTENNINDKKIEDISDYITQFRYYKDGKQLGDVNKNTTFAELIMDYKNQYPRLIEKITKKIKTSCDFNEFQAWMYMLEQNRTNNSIYFIFKNHTKFSEYINSMDCAPFVNFIKTTVYNKDLTINHSNVENLLQTITNQFKKWVNTSFSKLVYENYTENSSGESQTTDADYIHDMLILFNEFLSVYSELSFVNDNFSLGNKEKEGDGLTLQLFYNPTNIWVKDSYSMDIGLYYDKFVKVKDILNKTDDENNIHPDELINLNILTKVIKLHDNFYDLINKNLIRFTNNEQILVIINKYKSELDEILKEYNKLIELIKENINEIDKFDKEIEKINEYIKNNFRNITILIKEIKENNKIIELININDDSIQDLLNKNNILQQEIDLILIEMQKIKNIEMKKNEIHKIYIENIKKVIKIEEKIKKIKEELRIYEILLKSDEKVIVPDPFDYDCTKINHLDKINDKIGLSYEQTMKFKTNLEDNVSFKHYLKLTDHITGEIKYYAS